jgi:GPH family glycoside/pentoside/hexuronide:cation symporter
MLTSIPEKLNLRTKLAYGVGELASALPTSTAAFFLLYFLTTVAGLNADLAGSAMLMGKVWDAVTDPIVGWLSDRTRSPLGRRYPWMLGAAVPLGIYCVIQWIVPPTNNQWILLVFYTAVSLFAYTAFTSLMVPFSALAAELTQGYDERTTLISFKSSFSLGGSIFALLVAGIIFKQTQDLHRAYLQLGTFNGIFVVLAIVLSVCGTYERYQIIHRRQALEQITDSPSLFQQIQIAVHNRPFLYVIGLYLFAWTSVQISAVVLPYFVVNWMGLSQQHFIGMALAVQGTAVSTLVFWNWVGRRTGKRAIYFMGIPLALMAQLGLFLLQPGQVYLMYALAILAGTGVATVYLAPWSMLPDVVDFDELRTGQRREGLFFGFAVFVQKMGMALAVFLTGKILAMAGMVSAGGGTIATLQQPPSALLAIRIIIGPLPMLMILSGMIFTYFYPITREVHEEILLKLEARKDSVLNS